MRSFIKLLAVTIALLGSVPPADADEMIIDDFQTQPETRWRFFADTVMGGVSTGEVSFRSDGGISYARMTGLVSTANSGGFIQMRIELQTAAPAGTQGVRLVVRGNDQQYFVHLRTGGTLLPWQYYQAGFDVSPRWNEVRLPLTAFEASGRMLRRHPRAQGLKSLGVVAFGRDHDAEVDVREVSFY